MYRLNMPYFMDILRIIFRNLQDLPISACITKPPTSAAAEMSGFCKVYQVDSRSGIQGEVP